MLRTLQESLVKRIEAEDKEDENCRRLWGQYDGEISYKEITYHVIIYGSKR